MILTCSTAKHFRKRIRRRVTWRARLLISLFEEREMHDVWGMFWFGPMCLVRARAYCMNDRNGIAESRGLCQNRESDFWRPGFMGISMRCFWYSAFSISWFPHTNRMSIRYALLITKATTRGLGWFLWSTARVHGKIEVLLSALRAQVLCMASSLFPFHRFSLYFYQLSLRSHISQSRRMVWWRWMSLSPLRCKEIAACVSWPAALFVSALCHGQVRWDKTCIEAC